MRWYWDKVSKRGMLPHMLSDTCLHFCSQTNPGRLCTSHTNNYTACLSLTHSIPGTDISVPVIMAVANQVWIYSYTASHYITIVFTQAKACVLTTVSFYHFLNASAQHCSHVLAIFNWFWYTHEFEGTAAEQLVQARRCTQHSWGKMS